MKLGYLIPVFRPTRPQDPPPGCEIALIADDVAGAYARAVAEVAAPSDPPHLKPWGQTVAYVRDLNGHLVELCNEVTP